MPNLNQVNLIGNLTNDPELTYLPNTNTPVCNVGLAINRKWKTKDGEVREEVTYVNLHMYAKVAETFHKYVFKGDPIFINGRLKYESWTGKDGQKRSKLTVAVENFQFLKSKKEDPNDS